MSSSLLGWDLVGHLVLAFYPWQPELAFALLEQARHPYFLSLSVRDKKIFPNFDEVRFRYNLLVCSPLFPGSIRS